MDCCWLPRGTALIVVVTLVAGLGAGALFAQGTDDDDRVKRLFSVGKYTEALDFSRQITAKVEKAETASGGRPGDETARALQNLSWYALHARMFDEALAASDRALGIAPTLAIETNRAHALLFMGRLQEAEMLYLAHRGKPMNLYEEETWEDVIAQDFDALAATGLRHVAFAQILARLGIRTDQSRDEHNALRDQVRYLYLMERYSEAAPLAERYFSLARELFGENRREFAAAASWLGRVYNSQGRNAEATRLHQTALRIFEDALGPHHDVVGDQLRTLALAYMDEGRYGDAESLLRRTLAIRSTLHGKRSFEVVSVLRSLGALHRLQAQSPRRFAQLHVRATL